MIQHFSFKPMYNEELPGWIVTFFYERTRYRAAYEKDGDIRWLDGTPANEENIKKMIHELMLFHVYD